MTPISVCCLTFNSSRTIRHTLESVSSIADEIVIVDSGSTDDTIDIVNKYTSLIHFRKYDYHGRQMNYAIDKCRYNWVFCIDSDEMLNEQMIKSIKMFKKRDSIDVDAFSLYREWLFLGRHVHAFYPISSPDKIVRMFNSNVVRFNDSPVHDKPVGFNKKALLEGRLIHDCSPDLHDLYDKVNKYTSRYADGLPHMQNKTSLLNVLFNPISAFIKWYFRKRNFLDGFPGFILGTYAALYTFMKYAKLYTSKNKRY